jgi:hypothetical protein
MKISNLYKIFPVIAIFLFASCGNKQSNENKLETHINAIEKLASQSNNINTAEEAFQLLRSFNKNLNAVKSNVLSLEKEYLKAQGKEKESIKKFFDDANEKLNKSAKTIYKAVEPYKDDPNVADMLKKINGALISQ